MILDGSLLMSEIQDLGSKANASVTVSTNIIDLEEDFTLKDGWGTTITSDIGEGGGLTWNIIVEDEAVAGASAAIVATLVGKAANASISSGGTTIATLTIEEAAAIGTRYSVSVPSGEVLRYLGVLYTISGGGSTTAGKITSFISLDHQT